MDFEAIRVDGFPIDAELTDTGNVGPDLSAAAHAYLATPRALVWRNPSPDWKLFVVLLPLASRLSLMANPIFAQLVRDWGHTIRFVGVDRDQCVHDFRSLLTSRRCAVWSTRSRAGCTPTARRTASATARPRAPPRRPRSTCCSRRSATRC